MNVTPAALDAIFYSFDTRFQQALKAAAPFYGKVATETTSMGREERYAWMDRIPKMREWLGERQMQNAAAREQAIINKDYELTMELDRNTIQDDRVGLFNPTVDMMGQQAAFWPDDLVVAAMQAGATSLNYDGQYFFDDDHPINMDDANSSTQSNKLTLALSSDNYATARAAMMAYKGADGRPLQILPNLLVVPPALEKVGRLILNADMIATQVTLTGPTYGAAMQTNVLKGTAELLVVPQLANEATTWYLLDTSKPIKPFLFQLRKSPEFVYLNKPDSENLFFRKKFIFGVDSRGAAGYGLWPLAAKCTP